MAVVPQFPPTIKLWREIDRSIFRTLVWLVNVGFHSAVPSSDASALGTGVYIRAQNCFVPLWPLLSLVWLRSTLAFSRVSLCLVFCSPACLSAGASDFSIVRVNTGTTDLFLRAFIEFYNYMYLICIYYAVDLDILTYTYTRRSHNWRYSTAYCLFGIYTWLTLKKMKK